MKRSLLLAALMVGLVGCGGGDGGTGVNAQRDVEDWLDRVESAYNYALDESSESRYADLLSLNYCENGRTREDELDLFVEDVQDGQAAFADDVVLRDVQVSNARYENDNSRIIARVRYRVEFFENGRSVLTLPTFEDSRFVFQREGGRYRALGSDTGCFLLKGTKETPSSTNSTTRWTRKKPTK
ncbi:hypothetical protein EON79_02905 [bacterium]|nr:MAG: hypothetical protein EON79_02905 [bacterium]